MKKTIAIIGAGLAGITTARTLNDIAEVTVFEKSRGLGGRMAQRRREDFTFDHGAQYFSARSKAFISLVAAAVDAGAAASWPPAIAELPSVSDKDAPTDRRRYIGMPGMSSFATHVAEGLNIRRNIEIGSIERTDSGWHLNAKNEDKDEERLGAFDFVVSAAPAPQAARLLPKNFSGQEALSAARMSGCFTLMIGSRTRVPLAFEAARLDHPVLSWMAANNSKPGRDNTFSLTVHSRNDWAETHMETDRETVKQTMLAALAEITGLDLKDSDWIDLHRWRYANVEKAAGVPYILDETQNLAACGDWCLGNRVEAAFESGRHLGLTLRQWVQKG